jgi:hypothetical protein
MKRNPTNGVHRPSRIFHALDDITTRAQRPVWSSSP